MKNQPPQDEVVSLIAHQLKTPLTAMGWFLEMTLSGDAGPLNERQTEFIQDAYTSNQNMIALVNDFLNFSRLERGVLQIDPEEVQLEDVLADIIHEAAPLKMNKDVTIQFDRAIRFDPIFLDVSLVRQVFHNLLTNAIRYSKSGEKNTITIEIQETNSTFIVSVADNGIGIPKEEQKKLFGKFFRSENAIQAVSGGTGLGLYLAKLIMDVSGGKIWFESEEGEGTTFFVELPKSGMVKKEGKKGISQ